MSQKTIEEKYTSMTEIEHVLSRSEMYIGSMNETDCDGFVYNEDTGKMDYGILHYIPALYKLFDEIISNSCDEYRRKDNMGLTSIKVTVDLTNNSIVVFDNGGIPVKKHKQANMYVPEFIFGQLRTSSNYNDNENRAGIGLNGLGASLTNIFSKRFTVRTADNKKEITVEWKNNMTDKKVSQPKSSKTHFTEISFNLDFEKFGIKGIPSSFISVLHKRCIDAAAANPELSVSFTYITPLISQTKEWKFSKFEDYMNLYSEYIEKEPISYKDDKVSLWIYPDAAVDVSFVNGAECSKGTHLKAIRQLIAKPVIEYIKKKNKIDVTAKSIDSKYGIFGLFNIDNPVFSSQTKEELVNTISFTIPDKFLQKIIKSEIVNLVLDWYAKKQEAEDLAKVRKMNKDAKKLLRSDKFIDCNSKKRSERTLIIFEGDSAGAAFRTCRNPVTQAAYFMRGVPKSVYGCSMTEIMKNQVFNDIVNIIGLRWGTYNDKNDLRFSKIIIGSDMDPDGSHIAGLLLLFFNCFPELFEQHMICRLISPFIIASKGKQGAKSFTVQYFNTLEEYRKAEKKLVGYDIKHVKGLGTLNKEESKEMYRNPVYQYFTKDQLADIMFKKWFDDGKEGASTRKDMMKDTVMSEGSLF